VSDNRQVSDIRVLLLQLLMRSKDANMFALFEEKNELLLITFPRRRDRFDSKTNVKTVLRFNHFGIFNAHAVFAQILI
jgi:hypothetical protein